MSLNYLYEIQSDWEIWRVRTKFTHMWEFKSINNDDLILGHMTKLEEN